MVWLRDDARGGRAAINRWKKAGAKRNAAGGDQKFSRSPIMSPQLRFELYISQELDLGYNERSWGQTGKVRCESWLDLFRYEIYFSPLRRLREM